MADPVTHILLGMASCPQRPVLGGIMGLFADVVQLIAGVWQTITRWRETHEFKIVTNIWASLTRWMWVAEDLLHDLVLAGIILLLSLAIRPFALLLWSEYWIVPLLLLAHFIHTLVDMFTHDSTTALYPLEGVQHLGKTFHSLDNLPRYWWVVLLMIGSSFYLTILRGVWQ